MRHHVPMKMLCAADLKSSLTGGTTTGVIVYAIPDIKGAVQQKNAGQVSDNK